jgi:hypothetical protein
MHGGELQNKTLSCTYPQHNALDLTSKLFSFLLNCWINIILTPIARAYFGALSNVPQGKDRS